MASTNRTPHMVLMVIIAQIVFVIVLSELTETSDALESIIMTFVIGLWMVYFINSGPALISKVQGKVGF